MSDQPALVNITHATSVLLRFLPRLGRRPPHGDLLDRIRSNRLLLLGRSGID